jgi:hypothetical protein
MTTIQSHTRWVPRKLVAVACIAMCMLLAATAAQARSLESSPVAHSSSTISQTARSATTAYEAAARTLASRTRALHRCQRVHPRHCRTARRAVKRAAGRLAATQAQPASFTGNNGFGFQLAPTITVSKNTLSWKAIDMANTYVLARRAPGQAVQTSIVTGTSTTPSAVPGATVSYRVRARISASTWSAEVSISYPTTSKGLPPKKEAPALPKETPEPAKEAPAPTKEAPAPPKETPEPAKEAPAHSATFQPGLNAGTNMQEDLQGATLLGAKLVRVGWSINTTVAAMEPVIAGYAAKGIQVQPLAEFYGTMPTPAEAQNLANWAKAYGPGGTFWTGRSDGQLAIPAIEFGNETTSGAQYGVNKGESAYTALAETYATRFQEAAEAIKATGTGVGLLAQEDDKTGDWINGMYAAVPGLTKYVAGWVIHPYGGEQYNRGRFSDLIAQTAEHGASAVPIDVTEWGVTTDNGRCLGFNEGLNPCMTYEEAAHELKSTVAWMTNMLGSRLEDFFIYQVRDQKPTGQTTNWQDYFGALQHELQPKGAYTTQIESLLSS